jgi:hypothetical protein
MSFRSSIPDFALANNLYIGATVTFWGVDINGNKTAVKPALYAGPTGIQTVPNPQVLDGEGKFAFPVYHDVPVIAEAVGITVASVETGIIMPAPNWGGNWATGVIVQTNTFLRDPVNLSIYIATTVFTTSGSLANDIAAGHLVIVFQGEAATVATNAANTAVAAAAAAAASAADAAAVLANAALLTGLSIIVPRSTDGTRPTPTAAQRTVTWSDTRTRLELWNGTTWGALIRSLGDIGDVDMASTPPASGDGIVFDGALWKPGPAGGGMFKGNLGTVGSRSGDILRIAAKSLTLNTTIASTENAYAPGPLTIASGVTLTVATGGNLVIL